MVRRKTVQINLKVTPELKAALEEQAILYNATSSDLARAFLWTGVRRGLDWGADPRAIVEQCLGEEIAKK